MEPTDRLVGAAPASNSTMVCVKPRADEAAALADPGGEPVESLHVTLCYLGAVEGDLEPVAAALRPIAAAHAPLAGVVGGVGVFSPGPEGTAPAILLPDVPGLVELRVAITEALQAAGIDYSREHGFAAHITVAYFDPESEDERGFTEPLPFLEPLHFDELLIVRGDVDVVPLPLTGARPVTAAAIDWRYTEPNEEMLRREWPEAFADPFIADLIKAFSQPISLVAAARPFCLPAELRTKTDPVREAFLRAVMSPLLKEAGIGFDVTNPLVDDVLSKSGAHVVGISQTTQLDVMKVVHASYDEGLSIPDTAKAIRAYMHEASMVRATMIARTELAAAANGGSLAATRIVSEATDEAYFKSWMTAPGALHPRHEEYDGLDGQTVQLEEYFDVGGAPLQYPGDPDSDPAESINCRCTLTYTDKAGDLSDAAEGIDSMAAAGVRRRVAFHNFVLQHAYGRAAELEGPLAAILQPILQRAGDLAASRFEEFATDHMAAAGGSPGWTPPAAEEILPISCDGAVSLIAEVLADRESRSSPS